MMGKSKSKPMGRPSAIPDVMGEPMERPSAILDMMTIADMNGMLYQGPAVGLGAPSTAPDAPASRAAAELAILQGDVKLPRPTPPRRNASKLSFPPSEDKFLIDVPPFEPQIDAPEKPLIDHPSFNPQTDLPKMTLLDESPTASVIGLPEKPPAAPEQLSTVSKKPLMVPKQPPTVFGKLPAVSKQPSVMPEQAPMMFREPPTVSENPPTVTKQSPTVFEKTPTVPKQPPTVSEEPPTMSREPPMVHLDRASRHETNREKWENQLCDDDASVAYPDAWEAYHDEKKQIALMQIDEWLATLQLNDGPRVDATDDMFVSGEAHVDGGAYVSFEDAPPTFPHPRKETNVGSTSEEAMLRYQVQQVNTELDRCRREMADAAAAANAASQRYSYEGHPSICMRYASLSDMAACVDIYNAYVTDTIVVPELQPVSEETFRSCYEAVRAAQRPFIVAFQKVKIRGAKPAVEERVIGFAMLKDYGEADSVYSHTVELRVFVMKKKQGKGVGQALLQKLLSLVDPELPAGNAFRFVISDDHPGWAGQRMIAQILCCIPYRAHNPSKVKWLTAWLGKNGFKEAGHLLEVAFKFNKW
jgi:L-amino acid N-acyltransferase YncA